MPRLSDIKGLVSLGPRLVFWCLAGGILYSFAAFLALLGPRIVVSGVAGPVALYVTAVALLALLFRSYQTLSRERSFADTGPIQNAFPEAISSPQGQNGQNRVLDAKNRFLEKPAEAEISSRFNAEMAEKDEKMERLAQEGKVSELRHKTRSDSLQAELDYFKKEYHRVHEESRWLRSSLRQNHIDLAYLKDHVERFINRIQPSFVVRINDLFSLSNPSPAILQLARSLDQRLTDDEGSRGGHRFAPPTLPSTTEIR